MTAFVVTALAAASWVYLALARGGFWRGREDDRGMHEALRRLPADFAWPRLTAVIPARNEAELIGCCVRSLLTQRYAGELAVVVVDDHSSDGTAAAARRAAEAVGQGRRLTVLAAAPLPAGWTGKCWALAEGIAHAESSSRPPDRLLLTDADIRYEPEAVAALVADAVRNGQVLSSLMVKLRCTSVAERALVPAFVFFFQMIYPFAWVNQTNRRTAAAAGGCMLLQRRALADAGGIAAIRGEIIDDCALGARLKRIGAIHLALGERVQSLRASPSVGAIRRMVVRSAYAQLGCSIGRLVAVAAAMLVVFIVPVAAAVAAAGPTRWLGVAAWLLMGSLFVPIARRYHVSPLCGFALPAIAAVYLVFTVESAVRHVTGRGGEWKGRAQGYAKVRAATATHADPPMKSKKMKAIQP